MHYYFHYLSNLSGRIHWPGWFLDGRLHCYDGRDGDDGDDGDDGVHLQMLLELLRLEPS